MPISLPVLAKQLLPKMHLEIKLDEDRSVCGTDLSETELDIRRGQTIGQEVKKDHLG